MFLGLANLFQESGPGPSSPSTTERPPATGHPAPRHQLPTTRTTFVGRGSELAETRQLLASTRLLTLTGPGGSGKTRLAVRLADEPMLDSDHDVEFVDLSLVTDATLVPQTVATALRLQDTPEQSLTTTLAAALRTRRMLLVLDNCEHVLAGAADLVDQLLASCPELRVLATSREALHLPGEVVWSVPPLSLPEDDVNNPTAASRAEAVRLFVVRAKEVQPRFALTAENVGFVTSICRQLDGLPLAIEIVAARIRLMHVSDLAKQLGSQLGWRAGSERLLPPRMHTLRATITWSYRLLSAEQQVFFGRLGVFAGPFTPQAAVACAGWNQPEEEVLERLCSLVDRSLVTLAVADGDSTRYRLLETVRAYVRELRVEAGEDVGVLEQRHACYYLELAEQLSPDLTSERRKAALARIKAEYQDLQSALDWLTGPGNDPQAALQLAGALFWYWNFRGQLTEGRRWLTTALVATGPERTATRARALYAAGTFAFLLGELTVAHDHLVESVTIHAELNNLEGKAFALVVLAMVDLYRAELTAAEQNVREAVAIFQEAHHLWGWALALNDLGNVLMGTGDTTRARESYEFSLTLWEALGDTWGMPLTLDNLGALACQQGDYPTAAEVLRRALNIQVANGDRWGHAWSLMALADVSANHGDYDRATALYQESYQMHCDLGRRGLVSDCLVGLAQVAGVQRQPRVAALLFGAAQAQRNALGIRSPIPARCHLEHDMTTARGELSEAEFGRLVEAGRQMSPEQAIQAAEQETSAHKT